MRELHIDESLQSIDFADFEPRLQVPEGETLVRCRWFHVEKWDLSDARESCPPGETAIFTVLSGAIECAGSQFNPGDFFLIPATLDDRMLRPAAAESSVLRTTIPV
jgi:mannose-6-phosphate isomerase